jgi:hypothetical protein
MDYFEKYMKFNVVSARMTGYFTAKATHDSSIPLQARKEMLQFLINVWTETEPDSDVIRTWVKEWEESLKELSA